MERERKGIDGMKKRKVNLKKRKKIQKICAIEHFGGEKEIVFKALIDNTV